MKIINKYRSLPKSIKASLWFMICSIAQKGITFLTTPLFTRMLSPDEFGRLSLFLSWQEILIIFATLNLNYQVFNNGMVKFEKDKDGYTTAMTGLAFISSILVFILINIFFPIFNQITGFDKVTMLLMSINMFSIVVLGLWIVRNRYDFNYKLATVMTLLLSIANPITGMILVGASEEKVLFRIISITGTALIFAIIAFCLLLRRSRKIFCAKYWKYALRLSLPLIPHYISMVILHSSDRIMIGAMSDESNVAFYSISYNVAVVTQILLNAINASFIPWVYHKMKEKKYSDIAKVNTTLLLSVAVISVIPMLFAPEAVMLLGGNDYLRAVDIVPILTSSVFLIYTYSTFIIIETFYEKNGRIAIGSTLAALLNIILNYAGIKLFGYKAAAYSTLISYIALALFHWIMFRKALREKSIKEQIYNERAMIGLLVVIIMLSVAISFTYNFLPARIGLMATILLLCIINRKQLLKSFYTIKHK